MQTFSELIRNFEYPGRFLILGESPNKLFTIYGVTARSKSSRAKEYRYFPEESKISVVPTNLEIMSQGDLNLLSYDAVLFYDNGIVIGNGRQTQRVKLDQPTAAQCLQTSLDQELYEPDKYLTPRITGCLLTNPRPTSALHIIRSTQTKTPQRGSYEIQLKPGQAEFICTYKGPNQKPTPSYQGQPIAFSINFENAEDAAHQIYEALAPHSHSNQPDLRVSVIAVAADKNLNKKDVFIINSPNNYFNVSK